MAYNSSSRYLWLNSWRTARLSTSRAQGEVFTRSSCWGRSRELMWPLEVRWDEENFCNFYISIYIGYSPLGLFHISNFEIRLGACYWLLTNIWLFYNHCCWDLNLLQGSRESTRSLGRCFFATRGRDTQVQSKEYQCWTITVIYNCNKGKGLKTTLRNLVHKGGPNPFLLKKSYGIGRAGVPPPPLFLTGQIPKVVFDCLLIFRLARMLCLIIDYKWQGSLFISEMIVTRKTTWDCARFRWCDDDLLVLLFLFLFGLLMIIIVFFFPFLLWRFSISGGGGKGCVQLQSWKVVFLFF